jgi:hypothetical protein
MAGDRPSLEELATPFYPPRARWYSGLWNSAYALRRQLHLDALRLPRKVGAGPVLLAALVPGYAWCAFGRKHVGRAMMAGYVLAGLVFLVGLGHSTSHLAMGVMISLHTISLLYLISRWPGEVTVRSQVARSLGAFLAVTLLIYLPLEHLVERHLFLPLRIGERVWVVAAGRAAASVQRGALIAYRIESQRAGNVRMAGGFGLGRVEALAGDTIEFGEDTYIIRGVSQPLRPHMPRNQEWVVPEKHWFVWPDSAMSMSGHAGNVTPILQDLSLVPESHFVGKPFRRWFGREQVMP